MIIANQRSNDRCQPATMLVTQRRNWVRSCTAQRKPVQIPFNDPYLEQDAAEREPINLYQKPLAQRGRRERVRHRRAIDDGRLEVFQYADVAGARGPSDSEGIDVLKNRVIGIHGDTPAGRSSATDRKSSVANFR